MHLSRLPALLLLAAATAGAQGRSVSSSSAAGIPTPRPFQHGESIVMGFDEASGYGDAVREAILGWRFEPATIRGVPVAQLVERGFRFAR
ncbi:MAG: energy transducer TonB [Gemmatimonadaceae bacterium]